MDVSTQRKPQTVAHGAALATRVDALSLLSYRCFRSLDIDLSTAQITMLYGANGCGKSAALDAIATALSQLAARVQSPRGRGRLVGTHDITHGRTIAVLRVEMRLNRRPLTVHDAVTRAGRRTLSLDDLRGPDDVPPVGSIQEIFFENIGWERRVLYGAAGQLRDSLLSDASLPLPVLVHYPTNRAILDVPLRIRKRHEFGQLEALDGALQPGTASNFRLFFEWFRNREDLENEERRDRPKHRDPQLQAVRRALGSVLTGYTDFRVRRTPLRMVCTKHGQELRVDQLCDGEKCLLALIGDLARRLAIANPGAKEPLHGDGVVLIDEIDLHLHPSWQRRVIRWLEETFPNCQFIVSTHSPQVLSSVRPDQNVFLLREDGENGVVAEKVTAFGRDTNTILEELMDVRERPEDVLRDLTELFAAIDDADLDRARVLKAALEKEIGESDSELQRAGVLLRRRERQG